MHRHDGGMSYQDGSALWAAVKVRANVEAGNTGAEDGAFMRRFMVDRFLARVFARPLEAGG